MFENVLPLIAEHEALQQELGDPALHSDPVRSKRVNRRYAELSRIVAAHAAWRQASDDLAAARELADLDDAIRAEIPGLETEVEESGERLRRLLVPRDPNDARDAIMELRAVANSVIAL